MSDNRGASTRELNLQISLTCPKNNRDPNEDSFSASNRKKVFAVSDGASVSFASAIWSRILTNSYCSTSSYSSTSEVEVSLKNAVEEFNGHFDRESLPWMKQASFDQGTFATLLGLRFYTGNDQVQVFAVGDTTAVLCDGLEVVESFPYAKASEFNSSPKLISTLQQNNKFVEDDSFPLTAFRDWHFRKLANPSIFCMTDALAHWFLAQRELGEDPISRLKLLRKPHQFSTFVEEERSTGRLKRDDTTLLAFW